MAVAAALQETLQQFLVDELRGGDLSNLLISAISL